MKKEVSEGLILLSKILLLIFALLVIVYTFMFVLEIYPNNCNLVIWPLHEKCIDYRINYEQEFNNGLNEEKPYTVYFRVKVPDFTPANDIIYLETENGNYEMINSGEGIWKYNLSMPGEMNYRYNRNNLGFLTAEKFDPDSDKTFRNIKFSYDTQTIDDNVKEWRYFSGRKIAYVPTQTESTNIIKREFITGVSLWNYWKPGFSNFLDESFKRIASDNAKWVIISGVNGYSAAEPLPAIKGLSNSSLNVLQELTNSAKANGLKIMLKTKLCCNNPPRKEYDILWWDTWFAEAEKNLMFYADFANKNNIDAILIDYTYGDSIDGASYPPRDSVEKWEGILKKVNAIYNGKIGFNNYINSDYNDVLIPWPDGVKSFSNEVDFYGIEMWTSLGNRSDMSQEELYNNAKTAINHILISVKTRKKPIIITGIVYSSGDSCALGEKGVLSSAPGFLPWEPQNISIKFDGIEQAMVYEVILKAIADEEIIQGFFTHAYGLIEVPDSVDYSIRGKEAEEIVRKWFEKYNQASA